jgi:aldehyde:ferredoxin oxidoreductase
MAKGSATAAETAGELADLAGRGLTSSIVRAEVPPTSHPLGPHNKLAFAPGLLGGTIASTSGRVSVGAKSPLTGGIKESNAGGTMGHALAELGVAAIVVENAAPAGKGPYVLEGSPKGWKLVERAELRLIDNYGLTERLHGEYGPEVSMTSVGSAGDRRLSSASIAVTDREGRPTRHAGRGGLGAVMGSKGLKAIVLSTEGAKRPASADPARFKAAARRFAQLLKEHPVSGETLPTYGTNALANVINAVGAYPTHNFQKGQFEGVNSISGETQRERILARGGVAKHGCHRGCTIQCSRIYVDEKGDYISKGPEYETVWATGANCGIDDLDIELEFGDAEGALALLDEARRGTPLGRIIASGAAATGRAFGVSRVPVVKGQALPAYDPRAAKGMGVTYATSTMGADHTAGYSVTANVLGIGGRVDPLGVEGQVELSRRLQIATTALDSTGLCLFTAFAILDNEAVGETLLEMINAHLGTEHRADFLDSLGKTVLRREREFNRAAGFTPADDRLPDFFSDEPLPPHNTVFDVPAAELDRVFDFEGTGP